MSLSDAPSETRRTTSPLQTQTVSRPIRLAITSVFGDPLAASTWSGAPSSIARELTALGADVASVHPRLPNRHLLWHAWRHLVFSGNLPLRRETLMRDPAARRKRARAVARIAQELGVDRILHTGTLDVPLSDAGDGVGHYLYCDHTWDLAMRFRAGAKHRESREFRHVDRFERQSYHACRHIFTFSRYVRDNLIEHYGVPSERITPVGSGFGQIRPYFGPKDYAHGPLLFVAKHFFAEKGGHLAIKAFRLARKRRPSLRLIIAGHERWSRLVGEEPGVHVLGHLPWNALEELYRSATLLLQPMLNDPWGQVYLEAMASRTPVIGLDRNGLPEITEEGRHGFLVPAPDPVMLAEALLDAVSDPDRLARMGADGQRHVVASYSWRHVAEAITATIGSERP